MAGPERPPGGDDCLNLNVWTPDPGATGLPVLVWIHGGSLKFGTGSDALYDGATFARDGIVTVTFNYRLHPAGFLWVGDRPGSGAFGAARPDRGPRVGAGQHRRVRRRPGPGHGGRASPRARTASGQLLAAPRARGLFRRAILQSGAASFECRSSQAR